jgi:hypothetical protein
MSDHVHAEAVVELVLPIDFDEISWDVQSKGWFGAARLLWLGSEVVPEFFTPERFAFEIERDLAHQSAMVLKLVVVLPSLDRDALTTFAASPLAKELFT